MITSMIRNFISLFFVASLAGCVTSNVSRGPTDVDAGPSGKIWFSSANYQSLRFFLNDLPRDREVLISGYLTLPERTERAPAIVIMHGGSGPSGRSADWYAAEFRRNGWATFAIDNVSGRGFSSWHSPGIRYREDAIAANYVSDAANALVALSKHPRIDSSRIAIIGQSMGGVGAIYSSHENLIRALLPVGLRYRAHAGVYGNCRYWIWGAEPTGAPVLFQTGKFDDFVGTESELCQYQSEYLKSKGFMTKNSEYLAYHGWDELNFNSTGGIRGDRSPTGPNNEKYFIQVGDIPNIQNIINDPNSKALMPRRFPKPAMQLLVRGDLGVTRSSTKELVEFFNSAFTKAD